MTAPSTKDIIYALRRDAGDIPAGQLMRDAADELKRLTLLLEEVNHIERAQKDEIERLRAELRKQGYTDAQICWIARGSGPIGARS